MSTDLARSSVTSDRIFNPSVVSPSEADAYLACQRKHYYSFGECLALKSKGQAISRGILGHLWLATFYENIQQGVDRDTALEISNRAIILEAYKKPESFGTD